MSTGKVNVIDNSNVIVMFISYMWIMCVVYSLSSMEPWEEFGAFCIQPETQKVHVYKVNVQNIR